MSIADTGSLQEIGARSDDDHAQRKGEFNPQIFRGSVGLNVESENPWRHRMNGVTSVMTAPTAE